MYKRQLHDRKSNKNKIHTARGITGNTRRIGGQRSTRAVSYTHLDVYKRQIIENAGIMGIPMPTVLKNIIDILNENG